jgi:hypothetical protein
MKSNNIINLPFLLFCIACARPIFASPADYIYTPAVEYGEKEVDFKYGSARQKDGTYAQAASVGFGYGAEEHWFTEFYVKQESSGNQYNNTAEWENKFQFTETGEYPVDIGLITELEAPLSSNAPWEFKFGPLLQSEFGKLQLNGNLLFERAFGKADESGIPYTTNFSYQWQAKYRWHPAFEFGLQGFGEMGKWNNWDAPAEQIHSIGPAIFGKLPVGYRRAVRYNAAWLMEASNAAPHHTFRVQVEYEF